MTHRALFISLTLAALFAIALMQTAGVRTQDRAPQDQSWNRRAAGTGDYQTVLEVSGRFEVSRAMKPYDALDLKSICAAKKDAERRAFLSADGYLSALEKSVDARHHQLEIARQTR